MPVQKEMVGQIQINFCTFDTESQEKKTLKKKERKWVETIKQRKNLENKKEKKLNVKDLK